MKWLIFQRNVTTLACALSLLTGFAEAGVSTGKYNLKHEQKNKKKSRLKELKCSNYRLVVDEENQKVEVYNCKTGCTVDLVDLPGDFCDSWNGGVGDEGARAFAKNSTLLTAKNAPFLDLKYKTFIPTAPAQTLNAYQSVTVVHDAIYLTTQNTNLFALPLGLTSGNYVVAIRRTDGKILWQKNFGDYTGLAGDGARGAPNVLGDYMWMVASVLTYPPQSTADPANPTQDLNLRLFGQAPFKGTGRRNASAVCVNRHTGDLVWVKQYGKVAKSWNDDDNFRSFGAESTLIPELDITGNGDKVPVLVAGTSYVGQYFLNGVTFSSRPNNKLVSAGIQRGLRSYINQGSVMFIHALTGDVIVETPVGPRNLVAGEKINKPGDANYEAIRDPFIPGHDHVQVRLNVAAGPLTPGSRFSINGGNWTCVTLHRDAADLGISEFRDTVPAILNGIIATSNIGTPVVLTTGQTVAANPTYQEMNVRIEIQWVPGFEGDKFTVVGHANPLQQFSVNPDLIGLRITKKLLAQDVLTADEAYELRYAGPSCWAAPAAINYDAYGNPVELYVATGQGHKTPYDEVLFFDSRYSTEVPPNSNFNDRQQAISDAVSTGDIAAIRQAEENAATLCKATADLADTAISPRGKLNLIDSIVAIDLRPGNLGKILWHYKTVGFDAWQFPQSASPFPNNGAGRSQAVANGFVEFANFWEQPPGLDGDMGQRASLVKGKHGKKDKIVWASKQGIGGVIDITDVTSGPSTPSTKVFRYLGSASTLGGANYGSAVDDKRLYTVQRNFSGDGNVPLNGSSNYYTPYAYYPKVNDTMPPSSPPVIWNLGDQYVSAMNLDTGEIEWESLLSPGFTATAASRGSGASCTPGLVIAQAADNKLRLFDSTTGAIVNAFDSEAGNSWAGVADNEIYAWIGRATGGTPTQYFKVFSLPEKITKKHKKKDCCNKKTDKCK